MKVINSKNAPSAIGPYVQAIQAGDFLYVSGQIPFDPKTMQLCSEDVKVQTKQCLENLKAIITEAGYTLNEVVKCQIFIKDMNQFNDINLVYGEYFKDHKPARVCVEVARLPRDVKVEIDAIVYTNAKRGCNCK